MKVLVTGSNGMVGRNIVDQLSPEKYELLTPGSKELDLTHKSEVSKYIKKHSPDLVIHCAGVVGGIQANIANPIRFLVANTEIGINIITASYENGVNNFINIASSCMYPKDVESKLSEDMILSGSLEPTNEGYALAKITATRLCEYISKESKRLLYKTVIPCNLYGKYDKFGENSHMIPAVIKKVYQAKSSGDNVEIWGDGTAKREFMYAEDLANFISYAINNLEKMPQNINVGLGYDYTIDEYYRIIAKIIGYQGDFVYDPSKPSGMKRKLICDVRLKEFGWSASTSLEKGIEKTYNYYLESQNVS